jgi:beta-glucanase (GH16 family)
MLGIWLVGFEEAPHESGELCLAELFGDRIGPGGSTVRLGVKAHHDPRLRDDVVDLELPLDATEDHTYAAEWDAERARFFVDDVLVREVHQGTSYPLMLLIDLFEFPVGAGRDPSDYPKSARVREVRGYRRR